MEYQDNAEDRTQDANEEPFVFAVIGECGYAERNPHDGDKEYSQDQVLKRTLARFRF